VPCDFQGLVITQGFNVFNVLIVITKQTGPTGHFFEKKLAVA